MACLAASDLALHVVALCQADCQAISTGRTLQWFPGPKSTQEESEERKQGAGLLP